MKVCPSCKSRFQDNSVFCPHDGTRLVDSQSQAPGDLSNSTLNETATLIQREHTDRVVDRYKARLLTNAQNVCVTVFQKDNKPSPNRYARLQEVITQLGTPLPHTILTVHSVRLDFDPPYIIESAPDAESLAHILREQGKLDWKTALKLICNIGRTLEWAATQNVFHRALTPDRIYVSDIETGTIQIGGWAQAEALLVDSPQNASETNDFAGYTKYLSPETAVNSAHIDTRALLYTLSLILFEIIAGAPPLVGTTDAETIAKHLNEKPQSLRELMPDAQLPANLDDILQMMWAKSPNKRFQSITAAVAALSSLLDTAPWSIAPKIERAETPAFQQPTSAATIAMVALTPEQFASPKPDDDYFPPSHTVMGLPSQAFASQDDDAEAEAEAEEKLKAEQEAEAEAEEKLKAEQEAEAEEKLKAEQEAEAEAKLKADQATEQKTSLNSTPAVFDPHDAEPDADTSSTTEVDNEWAKLSETESSSSNQTKKTLLMSAINFTDMTPEEVVNLTGSTEQKTADDDDAEVEKTPSQETSQDDDVAKDAVSTIVDLSEYSTSSTPFEDDENSKETEDTYADRDDADSDVMTATATKTKKSSRKKSRKQSKSKSKPSPTADTKADLKDDVQPRSPQSNIETQPLSAVKTDLDDIAQTPEKQSSQESPSENAPALKIGVLKSARPSTANDAGDDWFGMSTEEAWDASIAQEAQARTQKTERTAFIAIFIILLIAAAAAVIYFIYFVESEEQAGAQALAQIENAKDAPPAVDMPQLRRNFDAAIKSKMILHPRPKSALGFLEEMQREDKTHPDFIESRATFVQEAFSQSQYAEEADNLKVASDLAAYASQFDPEDLELKEWSDKLHARLIAQSPVFGKSDTPPIVEPNDQPIEQAPDDTPTDAPSDAPEDADNNIPTNPTDAPSNTEDAPPAKQDPKKEAKKEDNKQPTEKRAATTSPKVAPESTEKSKPAPNTSDVASMIDQARKAYSSGDLDQAQKLYVQASKLAPNDPTVHAGLGQVYFEQAQHDKALDHQKRAVSLRPNQTSYRIQLGMVYYRLNRYKEAIATWNDVLKQDPDNDTAKHYINLAKDKLG